ncbi:hypothetical protein PoB_002541200 [Plakobranchus ocellatus]|uniref:Uncharacterized protein n=1 Tax=Plakobranchus ocellatus TaxID=259542 RepID=A0AAV3ZW40_9GAST|nr:hypothetical protein PoB_002541200 [Plakobranchus ocellatus]
MFAEKTWAKYCVDSLEFQTCPNVLMLRNFKAESTLEAAVHASKIHVWKPSSFFGVKAHHVGCDFQLVEASELTFVFYSLSCGSGSAGYGKWGCHFVTAHNPTNRCEP